MSYCQHEGLADIAPMMENQMAEKWTGNWAYVGFFEGYKGIFSYPHL